MARKEFAIFFIRVSGGRRERIWSPESNPDGTQRAVPQGGKPWPVPRGLPLPPLSEATTGVLNSSTVSRQDHQLDVRPLPLSSLVICSSLHLAISIRISPCWSLWLLIPNPNQRRLSISIRIPLCWSPRRGTRSHKKSERKCFESQRGKKGATLTVNRPTPHQSFAHFFKYG
jgi:hypothetical protein